MREKHPKTHEDLRPQSNDALRRTLMIFSDGRHEHQVKKSIRNQQTFIDYTYHYGGSYELHTRFTLDEFTQIFDISARTARRWLEPGQTPDLVLRHLALLTGAVVPSERFRGFYFADHGFYTPAGRRFEAAQLETIAWNIQEAGALRRQLARVEAAAEATIKRLQVGLDYWRRQAGAPIASNDDD